MVMRGLTPSSAPFGELPGENVVQSSIMEIVRAPTMGNVAKVSYTHADMIDFIIANPAVKQMDLAMRYGYSQGWVSNIMASDAWQAQYAKRREEVLGPVLAHTAKERMEALVLRSQEVLMAKLESPTVADATVLKAMELGARSLGMGAQQSTPQAPADLAALAERLVSLQRKVNERPAIEGEVHVISEAG